MPARTHAWRLHRPYGALLAASVLGPLLLFVAVAVWSWDWVRRETDGEIVRSVAILQAQGMRVMQVDRELLQRIEDQVDTLSWADVATQEERLHAFLVGTLAPIPEINSAYVVDADGEVKVSSSVFPVQPRSSPHPSLTSLREHPFFTAIRNGQEFAVDGPHPSRFSGLPVIDMAQRLEAPDGSFRGAIVLVVSPQRLAASWGSITPAGDVVDLVRGDGVVLARYPAVALGVNNAPPRFNASSMDELHAHASGLFDSAPSALDGLLRRSGFAKLGPYPLYMVYAVDRANIAHEWYPIVTAFGGLNVAAMVALLLASFVVIRRARGEGEARESQRALFRNAPAAMHSLDINRRILDVNERWLELFGYRREEIIGRQINDFYLPRDDTVREARWQEILRMSGIREAERLCVRHNGETFYALISVTIQRDGAGRFLSAITTVTDITARRRAEEAARNEHRFSQLLLESSADGIIAKDKELRYTLWNRGMESITGISRERILGRRTADAFGPDTVGTSEESVWRDALAGKSSSAQGARYHFPETGRSGFYDQTVSPLRDANGTVVGAIAFIHDATQRIHTEAALHQAQKMEAVGQLTGGIAHDFNNLLTVILGNLETLQRRRVGDEEVRRLSDAAMRGAERAATLTQRLLAFSRRQPLDPRPHDPNRLVAGMSDLLRRTLGERVAIETVLAGGLWWISVDANQLESALLNLAVNARDAMPDGGRLTIETANATIPAEDNATEVTPGDYVMIAVSDTGIGMSEEVRNRAFEPFFTTKEVGKGSGLGLSQVYGFVKQSGGHILIQSEIGKGTTVRVLLPRLQIEARTPGTPRQDQMLHAPTGSGRVLVVEDDEIVREHTVRVLQELGYDVMESADGVNALRIIETTDNIRLLFTDVGLPGGIDGRQLASAAIRLRPGLKVLLTTGYARSNAPPQGWPEGEPQLIPKPFTFAGLAAKIRLVLEEERV